MATTLGDMDPQTTAFGLYLSDPLAPDMINAYGNAQAALGYPHEVCQETWQTEQAFRAWQAANPHLVAPLPQPSLFPRTNSAVARRGKA